MPVSTVEKIDQAVSDQSNQLQSAVYEALLFDHDRASFDCFLRKHNLLHLRKLEHDAIDSLCNRLVLRPLLTGLASLSCLSSALIHGAFLNALESR